MRHAQDTRAEFLAKNPIAVGPPQDERVFRREVMRVEALRPLDAPLRVLDIGCGTGSVSLRWCEGGHDVTGLDLDPEFARRACERLARFDGRFRAVVGDATRLPLRGGRFDVVWMVALLEHIPDWRAAVTEAARQVAPGGVLVVVTTNRRHPFQGEVRRFPFYPWLPGRLRARVLAWIMAHRPDLVGYTDRPAVNWFDGSELRAVLTSLGLEPHDRLELTRPGQLAGVKQLGRWMLASGPAPALGRFLYSFFSSTVTLYSLRPFEARAGATPRPHEARSA